MFVADHVSLPFMLLLMDC